MPRCKERFLTFGRFVGWGREHRVRLAEVSFVLQQLTTFESPASVFSCAYPTRKGTYHPTA